MADDELADDPATAFGIAEAIRHRERGIRLSMFLGLFKYYRQSYIDLIEESNFGPDEKTRFTYYVSRFFDRVEIAFCSKWVETEDESIKRELQAANRQMTNEKNKFLTLVESLFTPVVFISANHVIQYLNPAAAGLASNLSVDGSVYYQEARESTVDKSGEVGQHGRQNLVGEEFLQVFPWIKSHYEDFCQEKFARNTREMSIDREEKQQVFDVTLTRMKDVSGKFTGIIAIFSNVTQRKLIQTKLRESRNWHVSVIDAMNEGFALHEIIYDDNGEAVDYVITDVNRSYETITGISKEAVIGIPASVLYGTGQPPYLDMYAKVANTGEPIVFESYWSPMKKHFRISVFSPEKGKFVTIFSDISSGKEALQEVRESQDRLSLAQKLTGIGTWDWDLQTGQMFWSDEVFDVFHMTRDEFDGTFDSFIRNVHPEDKGRVQKEVEACRQRCQVFRTEYRVAGKSGRDYWVASAGNVIRDDTGHELRMLGICHDITNQKMDAKKLEESEKRFRELFENMSNCVAVYDVINDGQNFVFRDFNTAAENTEAINRKMVIGRKVTDVFPGVASMGLLEIFRRVYKTGKPERFPLRFYKDNRITGWRDNYVYRLQGGVIVAIYDDVTEKKTYEVERESLIEELETKNAELERFTYTVSHDLKSPLVTIKGFLGILESDLSSGNQEQVADDIREISIAADKMRFLLDELLNLSRMGTLVEPLVKIDLKETFGEVFQILKGPLLEKNIEVEIAGDLPGVYGDPTRVFEMIQNLVENAIKYMGNQPAPRIRVFSKDVDGQRACCIQDNGIGIEARYHGKIFDMFEQLNQSADGTGIGLSIVRRIIKMHKGKIWLESEGQGKGSIFYFILPSEPQEAMENRK